MKYQVMNISNIFPQKKTKDSLSFLDNELLKGISESEAYGWWMDYLKRYSGQEYVETISFDDEYLATITLQAS
jgi:hypothetical protein